MKKWLVALFVLAFFTIPQSAFAHSFGKLYNLPVPFWMYAYGAAAAVILSFIAIGYFTNQRRGAVSYPSRAFQLKFLRNGKFALLAKGVSILLFLLTVTTGIIGQDDSFLNFNMTFFWIIFVLGGTYLSALVGNLYSLVNPFEIIINLFSKEDNSVKYPEKFSYWPALILYFIFIWIELIGQVGPFELSLIVIFYFLINTVGALLFGSREWFRYGEFFNIFFELISKIAPVEYRNGKVILRPPFVGVLTSRPVKDFSMLLFILFMLSSTAFDGFSETTPWYRFYWNFLDGFARPIFGDSAYSVVGTIGLLLSPFFFFVIYVVLLYLSKLLTRIGESTLNLAYKFAYTLIPIALVYNVAHYYTLLITQGQEILRLISDPFGFGWNLFGTANLSNNFVPDANFTWHSQVAILLIGHIASVYLAHKVALSIFPTHKKALISQVPMLILMVTYTVIGLWILSQPIVSGI